MSRTAVVLSHSAPSQLIRTVSTENCRKKNNKRRELSRKQPRHKLSTIYFAKHPTLAGEISPVWQSRNALQPLAKLVSSYHFCLSDHSNPAESTIRKKQTSIRVNVPQSEARGRHGYGNLGILRKQGKIVRVSKDGAHPLETHEFWQVFRCLILGSTKS